MDNATTLPTGGRTTLIPAMAASAAVAAALAWSYYPNFVDLFTKWWNDPNYSHGFFVVPIAVAILWQKKDRLASIPLAPSPWGWLALVGVLALRGLLYERNELWLENATIPLVAASLVLALGGWRLLWWALPGVGFLWFMLPLPPSINTIMAGPLQRLATIASCAMLQAMGLPVLSEGNVILVGGDRLEVARACNGLSMLLSFLTLITATTLLLAQPLWERITILVSAIPIALVSNVLRIVGTALCYYWLGAERGEKIAHDPAGWAMMPMALILVWLEMRLLSWLVIEEDPNTFPLFPAAPPAPPLKQA